MSTLSNNIKTAIFNQLNTLVSSGILGAVIQDDLSKNVLDLEFPAMPCAVLGMAKIDSKYEYNSSNKRTYQFDILVVQRYDDIQAPTDQEDLCDNILNQFDNNFTLGGVANCGLDAVATPAQPVSSNDRTYIVFNVRIKAKALQPLTYNF